MHRKSFTLIELLIVIIIIGLLAGVIMISTSSSIDTANIAKSLVFTKKIDNKLYLNMVSQWDFDNPSNVYYDFLGKNNGTCTTCPTHAVSEECVKGRCLCFEADNTYVLLSQSFVLTQDNSTLDFWFKKTSSGDTAIFARNNVNTQAFLEFKSTGGLGGETDTNNIYFPTYTATANDYKWHNYVLVLGNADSKLYVDGVAGSSQAVLTVKTTLNSIGASSTTAYAQYLKGYVDEVKVYNKAFSEAQVKANYLAGIKHLFNEGKITKQEYNEKIKGLSYEK